MRLDVLTYHEIDASKRPSIGSGDRGMMALSDGLYELISDSNYYKMLNRLDLEAGTANGQMAFWDTDRWKHTETNELKWDDTAKRLLLGGDPTADLHAVPKQYADNLQHIYLSRDFVNGSFAEPFNATVSSDGTTVTMSLQSKTGGDLTMQWSTGDETLDCTPAKTITLTPGTLASPQSNYVYILKSTGLLTKSTTGWPSGVEHIKVSYFFVPTAAHVQSESGALINQNWNDENKGTDEMGHMTHMAARSRALGAIYQSGVDPAGTTNYITSTTGSVTVQCSSGLIMQMHPHNYTAKDSSAGDDVHITNDFTQAYREVTNLYDITTDASGGTLTNKYFTFVLWGVANKGGAYSPLMVNMPTGTYNNLGDAQADAGGYTQTDIPAEFIRASSTGFLIAAITVRQQSNTWVFQSWIDLRGDKPSSVKGGTTYIPPGSITNFPDDIFTIHDNLNDSRKIKFTLDNLATDSVTREYFTPDVDGELAVWSDITGGQTLMSNNAATGAITVLDDGKVGINVTPTTALHVKGSNWAASNLSEVFGSRAFRVQVRTDVERSLFITQVTNSTIGIQGASSTTVSDNINLQPYGGYVGIGIDPLAQLHINGGVGSLSTGLAFGDGDTGIYEAIDDTMYFSIGGVDVLRLAQGVIGGSTGTAGGILNEVASSTNPTLVPNRSDTDTGIGWAGADNLSLITGGVEAVRIDASQNAKFMKDVELDNGDLILPWEHTIKWKSANGGYYNYIDSNNVTGYYALRFTSNGGDFDTNEMFTWHTNKGGVSSTEVMALTRGGNLLLKYQPNDAGASDQILRWNSTAGEVTSSSIDELIGDIGYWDLTGNELYPNSTSHDVAIGATDALGYKLYVEGYSRLGGIQFDLTPTAPSPQEGFQYWDTDAGTLSLGMPGGNVNLQMGQEGLKRVRNESGVTIPNGSLVYTTGSSGNKPLVGLCDNTDTEKSFVLGMATEDIAHNSNGYIALWGSVSGETLQPINTSAYAVGTKLYMSTAGGWTATHPSDPTHSVVIIGEVQRQHATEGKIELLNPKYFTLGNNFDGTIRQSVINNNAGTSAAVGFTAVNDAGHRATFGLGGSNNAAFPDVTVFYGEGYGDNWYAVDGNKSHKWYTDPTDSHNNSALNYLRMELNAAGTLILGVAPADAGATDEILRITSGGAIVGSSVSELAGDLTGTLDSTYLRLDTTNDPLTGTLSITSTSALTLKSTGAGLPVRMGFFDLNTERWRIYKETNNHLYIYNPVSGNFPFHIDTSDNMYLTEGAGNVMIGSTSTPTESLEVVGNFKTSGTAYIGSRLRIGSGGSLLVPAIYWLSDADTGIWFPATGNMGFVTGGVEAIRVDENQNVGINTTSPGARLEVFATSSEFPLIVHRNTHTVGYGSGIRMTLDDTSGNQTTYGQITSVIVTDTNGVEDGYMKFETINAGSLDEHMRINPSGNVSIGNTNDTYKLEVSGLVMLRPTTGSYNYFNHNGGDTQWEPYNANSADRWNITIGGGTKTDGMHIGRLDENDIFVGTNGNVSIGSTYNGMPLNVGGTIYAISGDVYVNDNKGFLNADGNTGMYPEGDGDILFKHNDSEVIRFTQQGYLQFASSTGNRWILMNQTNTGTGVLKMQAGLGSAAYGGAINLYGHVNATYPGWVIAGISSGSGGKFAVNTQGTGGGSNIFTVDASGDVYTAGHIEFDMPGSDGLALFDHSKWFNVSYQSGYASLAWWNYHNGTNWVHSHASLKPAKITANGNGITFQVANVKGAVGATIASYSDAMVINHSGNIGIGVGTTTARVEIASASTNILKLTGGAGGSDTNVLELFKGADRVGSFGQASGGSNNIFVQARNGGKLLLGASSGDSWNEAVIIDTSANVGIGRDPSYNLDVDGTLATRSKFYIHSTGFYWATPTDTDSAWTQVAVRNSSSGEMSVRSKSNFLNDLGFIENVPTYFVTTEYYYLFSMNPASNGQSASASFDIVGSGSYHSLKGTIIARNVSGTTSATLTIDSDNSNNYTIVGYRNPDGYTIDFYFKVAANVSYTARYGVGDLRGQAYIDSSPPASPLSEDYSWATNRGIGLINPTAKLHISTGNQAALISSSNYGDLYVGDPVVGSRLKYGGQYISVNSAQAKIFTNNLERLRVTNSGIVQIYNFATGTSSDDDIVVVQSDNSLATRTVSDIIGDELDSVYLRLDTANDPLTNNLEITKAGGARITVSETVGTSTAYLTAGAGGSSYPMLNTTAAILRLGAANNPYVYIKNGGNVGIGTDSPDAALHVYGGTSSMIKVSYVTDDTYYTLYNTNSIDAYGSSQIFDIKLQGDSKIRVANSGNVGIGTTAPQSITHIVQNVSGDIGPILMLSNNYGDSNPIGNAMAISFERNLGSTTYRGMRIVAEGQGQNNKDTDLIFQMGDDTDSWDEKFRFTNDGKLGIGITNPYYDLSTSSNGTIATRTMHLVESGYIATGEYGFNVYASNNGSNGHDLRFAGRTSASGLFVDLMTIKNSGNVGIGTTSPTYPLDVVGNARTRGYHYIGTDGSYLYDSVGTLRLVSGGTIFLHVGSGWEYRFDTGAFQPYTDATNDIGNISLRFKQGFFSGTVSGADAVLDTEFVTLGQMNSAISVEDLWDRSGANTTYLANSSDTVAIGASSVVGDEKVFIQDTRATSESTLTTMLVKQGVSVTDNDMTRIAIHGLTQRGGWANIYMYGVIGEVIENQSKGAYEVVGVLGKSTYEEDNTYIHTTYNGHLMGLKSETYHKYIQGQHWLSNAYGVYIRGFEIELGAKANAWYGVYIGATSGAGTINNKWGVYQADSGATNYFAGDIEAKKQIHFSTAIGYPGSIDGVWLQTDGGLTLSGTGTLYDINIVNQDRATAIAVIKDTQNVYMPGYLGIGTTTPDAKLDVSNGASNGNVAIFGDTDNSKRLTIYRNQDSDYAAIYYFSTPTFGKTWIGHPLDATKATIFDGTTGNVGIGTVSPDNLLHVQGTDPIIYLGTDTNNKLGIKWDSTDGYAMFMTRSSSTWYSDTLVLRDGKVGIGTDNPSTTLEVDGGTSGYVNIIRNSKILRINADWSSNGEYAQVAPAASSGMGLSLSASDTSPSHLFLETGGNVGIGTDSPDDLLHISSTSPAFLMERTDRALNEKVWRMAFDGSDFEIQTQTDAYGAGEDALRITRTGTTINEIIFPNGTVSITDIPNAANTVDNILVEDSGVIKYRTVSDIIGNELDDQYVNVTGDTMTGDLIMSTSNIKLDNNQVIQQKDTLGSYKTLLYKNTNNENILYGGSYSIGLSLRDESSNRMLHFSSTDAVFSDKFVYINNIDNSYLWIRSGRDGLGTEESLIVFTDNTTNKYYLGKDSGNDFALYNYDVAGSVFKHDSSLDEFRIFSSFFKLKEGSSVNTIETTLTDDDTHLPTSGAVWGKLSTGYVPYTGATANVDLGDNSLIANLLLVENQYGNKTYIESYPDDGAGNDYTVMYGSNYTHSLRLRDSYHSVTNYYAVIQGGYIDEARITLKGFDGIDSVTNTSIYASDFATVAGKITGTSGKFTTGAADGYIAVSDADGDLVWTDPATLNNHTHSQYVPYTGATANVDLGNYNLTLYKNLYLTNAVRTWNIQSDNSSDGLKFINNSSMKFQITGDTDEAIFYTDLYVDSNEVWHAGNSNLSTVDWAALDAHIYNDIQFYGGSNEIKFRNAGGTAVQWIWNPSGTDNIAIGPGSTSNSLVIDSTGIATFGKVVIHDPPTDPTHSALLSDVQDGTNHTHSQYLLNTTDTFTGTLTLTGQLLLNKIGSANQMAARFANSSGNAFIEIAGTSGAAQIWSDNSGELQFTTGATQGTYGTKRYLIDSSGNHDFQSGTADFGNTVTINVGSANKISEMQSTHSVGGYTVYSDSGTTTKGFIGYGATLFSGTGKEEFGLRSQEVLTLYTATANPIHFYTSGRNLRYEIDSSGNHDFQSGTATFGNEVTINTPSWSNTYRPLYIKNGGNDYSHAAYDTLVVQAYDVPTIRIVEDGTPAVAEKQEMGFSVGDSHASITSTQDLRFYVDSNPGNLIYSGANGLLALSISTGGDATFSGAINVASTDTSITRASAGNINVEGNLVWHAGNDGSGSGLDADMVDGIQAERIVYGKNLYATLDGRIDLDTITKTGHYWVGSGASNYPVNGAVMHMNYDNGTQYGAQLIVGQAGTETYFRGKSSGVWSSWTKIWHEGNDGSGSGLDADLLDGQHGSYYSPTTHTHNYLDGSGAQYQVAVFDDSDTLGGSGTLTFEDGTYSILSLKGSTGENVGVASFKMYTHTSTSGIGNQLWFYRSFGTADTPANLTTSDSIALLSFQGYYGGGYSNYADITVYTTATDASKGEINFNVDQGTQLTIRDNELSAANAALTVSDITLSSGTTVNSITTSVGVTGSDNTLVTEQGIREAITSSEYSHPNHTGHVTSTGDGATVLTVAGITGQTALTSGLISTDELLVNDGGAIKRMDVSVLEAYMQANLDFTTDTDNYVDSVSFATGTGVLTLGRTGALADLTVDLDGRYSLDNHTHSQYLLNTTDTFTGTLTVNGNLTFTDTSVIIGQGCGLADDGSNQNVLIGYNAGNSVTSGQGNIFLGNLAGEDLVTGNYNIIMGDWSAKEVTAGTNLIVLGENALRDATGTLTDITAIGRGAAQTVNIASSMVAIGVFAGQNADGSSDLVAVGRYAGSSSTGIKNTAIGQGALSQVTTGDYNVGLGSTAGDKIANGYPNETSYDSVFIGAQTRAAASGQTNQIVIGTGAVGKGSNTVTLGDDNITAVYMNENGLADLYAGGIVAQGDVSTPSSGSFVITKISAGEGVIQSYNADTSSWMDLSIIGKDVKFSTGVSTAFYIDGTSDVVTYNFPIQMSTAVPIRTAASSTSGAGLNFAHGTAPTSPVDGDMWTTTTSAYIRINGVTKDLLETGTTTTINNNANNRIITGSATANTLEAEQYLTWDGLNLGIGSSGSYIRMDTPDEYNALRIHGADTANSSSGGVYITGQDSGGSWDSAYFLEDYISLLTGDITRFSIDSAGLVNIKKDLKVDESIGVGIQPSANDQAYIYRPSSDATGASEAALNVASGFTGAAATGRKQALRVAVNMSHTSGTSGFGHGVMILNKALGNGGTTTGLYGVWTRNDVGTGHTVTNSYGLSAWNPSNTGTITNNFGLYIQEMTAGSANYSIYTAGTSRSYFGGNVGFKVAPDATYAIKVNGEPASNGYELFTDYSDERLKTNIQNLVPDGESVMEKIRQLRPVTYSFNQTYSDITGYELDGRVLKGYIAQELMQVFPEMVKLNQETGYYDANASGMHTYIVEGLKEVDSEVELLKERVAELENILQANNISI